MKFLFTLCLMLGFTVQAKAIEKVILSPDNSIMINSNIDVEMVRRFAIETTYIRNYVPLSKPVYIVLYSGGGNTSLAVKMAEAMATLPNTKIICAWCASAAGMLFIDSGLPALATEGSEMMMHEMRWVLNLPQLEDMMNKKEFDREAAIEDQFNSIHYKRMKISKEAYLQKIRGKEWYVKGKDLKKFFLADEMVEVQCTDSMRLIYPINCKTLETK